MQTISFVKMGGLGNDFVLIDAFDLDFSPDVTLIKNISDRHLGVGCDQVLWLSWADGAVLYRIFNPDGSEVAQCGNGARCVGYYMQQVHNYKNWPLRLKTCAGQVLEVRAVGNDLFQVAMGRAHSISGSNSVMFQGNDLEFFGVDVGNPHAVFWLDIEVDKFNLQALGELMQGHSMFPLGVNVSIVNLIAGTSLKARVYERGTGETLACGSAACAIAASGFRAGLLESEVSVGMVGGALRVCERDGQMYQTGPVSWVFVGTWCHRQQNSEMFYFDVD